MLLNKLSKKKSKINKKNGQNTLPKMSDLDYVVNYNFHHAICNQ